MTERILQHLRLEPARPTHQYLEELISAYCSRVPWESVSKIVRKSLLTNADECPRSQDEFWDSAIRFGTGGTCYESNWAFFCFLQRLGFSGYLTINRILDKSSKHSAVVIVIQGIKYIVDIGYPLYAPVPIRDDSVTVVAHQLFQYRCTPVSPGVYEVENVPHPEPYLYHLRDSPVDAGDYLKIMRDDYGNSGLFSDRIVIRKVVEGVPTRFDSEDTPYNIHTLLKGEKQRTYIEGEELVSRLCVHFGLDEQHIGEAFIALNTQNTADGGPKGR